MHLVTYNKDDRVRTDTLKEVSAMLYGAYRSCDPSLTLRWASEAIGRSLSHRDILVGKLTECEARSILERIDPLVPDLRETILHRATEMLKP